MTIIYRAMCEDEFKETIRYGKAQFRTRFKWFSTNLEFIHQRVRDGRFNNSAQAKNRYDFIVAFDADLSKADWIRGNEIQFDVRRNASIKVSPVPLLDQ